MGSEATESAENSSYFDSSLWERAASLPEAIAESVARELQCDEVHVHLKKTGGLARARFSLDGGSQVSIETDALSVRSGAIFYRELPCAVPLVVNDLHRARLPGDMALALSAKGVRSFGVFPLERDGELIGLVACFFKRGFHRWRADELEGLSRLSESLPASEQSPQPVAVVPQVDSLLTQYQRLARQGNLLIVTTDTNFRVTNIFGNTEALLGVSAKQVVGDPGIWSRILDPQDLFKLQLRIMRMRVDRTELREEIRVVHQGNGCVRWIMLRALPQISNEGQFIGWEGFGVDVTEKRQAQAALLEQNRRLEALFEIAASLQGYADPAAVTFKGLRALLRATRSECGYACFFDRERNELEVVAAVGITEEYLSRMSPVLRGPSLLRLAVEEGQKFLIGDVQLDSRANQALAKREGVHSTIVMPLMVDKDVYGAMVLFTRERNSYDAADGELTEAAASQIALAIRQAEQFEAQKRRSASMNSLYRISRELAKYRAVPELARSIIPILREEFPLRQGWLGLVQEASSVILGVYHFGEGVSEQVPDVTIEVGAERSIVRSVFEGQRPVVARDFGANPEGIVKVLSDPRSVVVVPLVAVGQVLGVMVLEPLADSTFSSQERLDLLMSMAGEMATAVMAGRFEAKMGEAQKMRMAGLLASGVAHNFNNMLQAILGQVSLIEMQSPRESPIRAATETISEAAKRGASLVGQLLSFATKGTTTKKLISLSRMLEESADLYRSLIGSRITCAVQTDVGGTDTVLADLTQLQQVITNILVNSKEAIAPDAKGEITISARSVVVKGSEVSPELAPGRYVRVDVQDNGVGMTAEQQSRCFEPFFTTKNIDRGTGVGLTGSGLGLSTAYSIVRQHDGMVTAHSVPGEGTVVSVYLPLFLSTENGGERARQVVPEEIGGVLLLGMETGVQPFVSSILESLGYRSKGVFDARHVADTIKKEPGVWRMVMVDVDGLGPDSIGVCTQLLSNFSDLSITLVGASMTGRNGLESIPAGRIKFVEKPLSVWSVESALQGLRRAEVVPA